MTAAVVKGSQEVIGDFGGEDADYFLAGVRRSVTAPVLHPQFPTAIPYGILASVWNSKATADPRSPKASSQPLFWNFLAGEGCFPV